MTAVGTDLRVLKLSRFNTVRPVVSIRWMTRWSSTIFFLARSTMSSSTLLLVTNRYTLTCTRNTLPVTKINHLNTVPAGKSHSSAPRNHRIAKCRKQICGTRRQVMKLDDLVLWFLFTPLITWFFCPMRWARAWACMSFCGFQSLSKMMTVSAVARFTPRPPARVDNRKQKSYKQTHCIGFDGTYTALVQLKPRLLHHWSATCGSCVKVPNKHSKYLNLLT